MLVSDAEAFANSLGIDNGGVMPYAVLDTHGNCGLRVIVESGVGLEFFIVTRPPITCDAYEAFDGYTAGEVVAA
jgi:hypothetical protein